MVRAKKDVNVDELENNEDVRLGVYEVGYLMIPTIPEEGLGEEVVSLKDALLEKGVNFISDEYPKLIELAYEMTRSISNKKQKFSYGYFGWVKFECKTDVANAIKDYLDKNEKLIRFILIKTIRENTMSVKRSYKQEGKRRTSTKTKETVEEINEEEIDKEIEALVV